VKIRVALKHHKSQCYVIKFELLVVFSTNKTDRHDITEILLKVALNTIEARRKPLTNQTLSHSIVIYGVLTPLLTIFQLYHGGQFYW
jgi:hypothetical protein